MTATDAINKVAAMLSLSRATDDGEACIDLLDAATDLALSYESGGWSHETDKIMLEHDI